MSSLHQQVARQERQREILTPEGVPLRFTVASLPDRVGAFMLDMLLIIGISIGISMLMPMEIPMLDMLLIIGISIGISMLTVFGGGWVGALFMLLFFLLRTFYFTWFEVRWHGSTPGKRQTKIRVISRHGGSLKAEAVFARNFTREVEYFVPLMVILAPQSLFQDRPAWLSLVSGLWLLILIAVPFCNRDRLRIGDLIAGTMVVEAPKVHLLPDLSAKPASRTEEPTQPRYTFTKEHLGVYGIYELQVLEDVLRAEGTTQRQIRQAICKKIMKKINWRGARRVNAEVFLREFYAAQRAHLEQKMLFGQRKESKYDNRS